MSRRWFHVFAGRLADPFLLLSAAGVVEACNAPARRALGAHVVGSELACHVHDGERFRHYLRIASRSTSTLPGAASFDGGATRWRCDAAGLVIADERLLTLQLRTSADAARRFLTLNEHIERLHAEIRRRESLEHEREELLERERQARESAEDAGRFKDDLLAAVSHELRTPLHAIQGWIGLVKSNPSDRRQLMRAIEVIERNVAAEVKLTEDLVDASLSVTGRMKIALEPVDLEVLLREAVDTALPAAQAKQVRLEVIADVRGCVIHGDPARLLQIVWNLLANATRHTPKGGKIQVVLRRVNSHVEIIVSDTGEGIAPDVLPYVFDRFHRADRSLTRRHGGLGLGLAIVRHLVELHGGFVIAHSDGPGTGATFTVNLPLPLFEPKRAVVDDPPESLRGGVLSGTAILLVEDHDDSRELLAMILEAAGAKVTAVAGAAAAAEAFRAQSPDVFISDIEMPEEDGFTLMRKLRNLEAELGREPVKAIAVSAHSIGDAGVHALRAGYHAFLPKPIAPDELVAMIVTAHRGPSSS